MNRLVLIDGVNFFYRGCWSGHPTLTVRGEDTTYVYAFMRNIISLIRQFEKDRDTAKFVICWDGGYNERIRLSSEAVAAGIIPKTYKQERREGNQVCDEIEKARHDEVKKQLVVVGKIMEYTRVANILVPGEEADDLVGTFAFSQKDNFDEIILVSTDKDYYQLLIPKVKIYNSGKSEYKDDKFLKKEYNLDRAEQWVDVGALAGESGRTSDTIYGVPGISYITGSKLIAQYGTLENLLKEAKEQLKDDLANFDSPIHLYNAVKAKEYKLKHHVKEMYVLAHEEIVLLAKKLKQIRTWLNLSLPKANARWTELTNIFNDLNFALGSRDINVLINSQTFEKQTDLLPDFLQ